MLNPNMMNGKMMEDVVSDFFYISVMQVAGIHVLFDLFVSNTRSKKLLGPTMKVFKRFLVCPIERILNLDDEWWYEIKE